MAAEGPALLWSAMDMDPREDGDYVYVPTQLYPTLSHVHAEQNLPPLALHRLHQMCATEHSNATVGNIYIGNCVEPMDWAGENVGYIIDASDGRSNVRRCHRSKPPSPSFPHGGPSLSTWGTT